MSVITPPSLSAPTTSQSLAIKIIPTLISRWSNAAMPPAPPATHSPRLTQPVMSVIAPPSLSAPTTSQSLAIKMVPTAISRWSNAAMPPAPSGNTLTTVDSTGDVGYRTSITLGADNFPVISYRDNTNGDLEVVKCADATCASSGGNAYSGYGVDVGSVSKFFRKGYFANLYAKNTTVSLFDVAEDYPTKDLALSAGILSPLIPITRSLSKGRRKKTRSRGSSPPPPVFFLSDTAAPLMVLKVLPENEKSRSLSLVACR